MLKIGYRCPTVAMLVGLCLAVGAVGATTTLVSAATDGVALDLRAPATSVPDTPQAHLQRGIELMLNEDYAGALVQFRVATDLDPDWSVAHVNLGHALKGLGRIDEAIKEYATAIHLAPGLGSAYFHLGKALLEAGNVEAAIANLHIAMRLLPNDAQVRVALSSAFGEWRDYARAAEQAAKAAELDPKLASAQAALGWALLQMGNTAGAVDAYQLAVKLERSNAQLHDALGTAQVATGDLDAAISAYRQATRLDPSDARIRNNLAAALRASGQVAAAGGEAGQATMLAPDNVQYYVTLAGALREDGDLDGAVRAYRDGLRIDVSDAEVHKQLGLTLYERGNLSEAIRTYGSEFAGGNVSDEDAMDAAATIVGYFAAGARLKVLDAMDPRAYEADFPLALRPSPLPVLERAVRAIVYALRRQPAMGGTRDNLIAQLEDLSELDDVLVRLLGSAPVLQAAGQRYTAAVPLEMKTGEVAVASDEARIRLCALAVALSAWQDLIDAAYELRWASRLQRRDAETYSDLGRVLLEIADLRLAKTVLSKAVRLQPDLPPAHYNLALVCGYLGDMDAMLLHMSAAKSLGMTTPEVNTYMALAYLHYTELEKASALLEEAIEMDPDYAPARYYANLTTLAQQSTSPVTATLVRASKTATRYATGYYDLRAEFVRYAQEPLSGLVDASVADPDLEEFYCYAGLELALQGGEAGAEGLVVLHNVPGSDGLYPDWSVVANNLGVAAALESDLERAQNALNLAVSEQPDYALAHWNLAQVLERSGDKSGAQEHLAIAAELISAQGLPYALTEPGLMVWRPQPRQRRAEVAPQEVGLLLPTLAEAFHLDELPGFEARIKGDDCPLCDIPQFSATVSVEN